MAAGRRRGWTRAGAWLAAGLLAGAAGAGERLAALLPADTLAYLQPPERATPSDRFDQTVVGQLAASHAFRPFLDDLRHSRGEFMKSIAAEAGLPPASVEALFAGRLTAALLDLVPAASGGFEPVYVVGLELDAPPPQAELFATLKAYFNQPRFLQMARDAGVPANNICLEEKWPEVPGVPVLFVAHTTPLRLALVGNTLLACRGSGRDVFLQVLRRHGQPAGRDSLAHTPAFQAAWRGAEATAETRFAYVNTGRLLELAGAVLPPSVGAALEIAGLDGAEAAGFASGWVNDGLRQTLYFHLPNARTGLLATLDARDGAERLVSGLVPAEATWGIAARLDWARFYEEFPRLLDTAKRHFGYERGFAISSWAESLTLLDVPARDALATLGTEMVLVDVPDGYVPLFYYVRVAPFLETVAKMERAAGRAFETLTVTAADGETRWDIRYLNRLRGSALPIAPSFCVLGRHQGNPDFAAVALATHPQAIAGALATMGRPALETSEDFQRVMAGLGGPFGMVCYSPTRDTYRRVYNALLPLLSSLRPAPPYAANPALLPPGSVVAPRLFGSAVGFRQNDQGVTVAAYSPVGLGGPLAWLLDGLLLSNPATLMVAGARLTEGLDLLGPDAGGAAAPGGR